MQQPGRYASPADGHRAHLRPSVAKISRPPDARGGKLRNPSMDSFNYRDGQLYCEDLSLDELATKVGSPAYV